MSRVTPISSEPLCCAVTSCFDCPFSYAASVHLITQKVTWKCSAVAASRHKDITQHHLNKTRPNWCALENYSVEVVLQKDPA